MHFATALEHANCPYNNVCIEKLLSSVWHLKSTSHISMVSKILLPLHEKRGIFKSTRISPE